MDITLSILNELLTLKLIESFSYDIEKDVYEVKSKYGLNFINLHISEMDLEKIKIRKQN